jgi:hypothetical protein
MSATQGRSVIDTFLLIIWLVESVMVLSVGTHQTFILIVISGPLCSFSFLLPLEFHTWKTV